MHTHNLKLPVDPNDRSSVSETFKALADGSRLDIALHLLDGERNVSDLVATLGLPQSTVSRHLAVMRHAEVVAAHRDGTSVYYRLADDHLADLIRQAFAHAEHRRLNLPDHGSEKTSRGTAARESRESAS